MIGAEDEEAESSLAQLGSTSGSPCAARSCAAKESEPERVSLLLAAEEEKEEEEEEEEDEACCSGINNHNIYIKIVSVEYSVIRFDENKNKTHLLQLACATRLNFTLEPRDLPRQLLLFEFRQRALHLRRALLLDLETSTAHRDTMALLLLLLLLDTLL